MTRQHVTGGANGALVPIDEVLPHRGTMRLVEEIVAFDDEWVRVATRVSPQAWYADGDGAMSAWIGIELMAQAIAVHVGLLARRTGGCARPGVLLGTSRYETRVDTFAAGVRLVVEAKLLLRGDEGHGAYDCCIELDGQRMAQAVVKVFEPKDFQAFIEGSFAI